MFTASDRMPRKSNNDRSVLTGAIHFFRASDPMNRFDDVLAKFAKNRNSKGCTESEIVSLTPDDPEILPESYRKFLRVAGNGIDDFLTGSDFRVPELEGTREAANQLLENSGLPPLPRHAFVFVMHQGFQFYYFDNESVYYFQEGWGAVKKSFDSFEHFFFSVVSRIEDKNRG